MENKNKGGKAKLIKTSFSKENVKWENIFIQEEEKKEIKKDEKDKGQKEPSNNLSSKLAVIIYDDVNKEWLRAQIRTYKYFEKFVVFSLQEEQNNNIIAIDGKENINQQKMRKIVVGNENPFLVAYQKGEKEDIELIKQSPGSPVYYSDYFDYIGDSYVIAIINEFFEIQYFNKNTFNFLVNIVNKLRKEKIKINKNYAPELLTELNL